MLTQQAIIDFCNKYDYDIKKSNNARWIDQKCAADVVTVVADCIYHYILEKSEVVFTTKDIWYYSYAVENIETVFKKPGLESTATRNEYDKFFQQPMEMLANAKVLHKMKRGSRNFYKVNSVEILEYIALREKNTLIFLKIYIEKVLRDSGIWVNFQNFFENANKNTYNEVKRIFSNFIITHTKINGKLECNRIFIKVLNPLAYFRNSKGTTRGRMSEQIITYDMLMYNRSNFRDLYAEKPKGVTRKEFIATHPVETNESYYRYQSSKAKRFLRFFNDQNRQGQTEYLDDTHVNDRALNMHHIFLEAEYPETCYYLENIIALTPTQHFSYAHPEARTNEIDEQYQHLLLLSKADRIQENLSDTMCEKIYGFSNFLTVLGVGFDDDTMMEIADMDFHMVINAINRYYLS